MFYVSLHCIKIILMQEIIKRNLKEIKLEPVSNNFKATYGTVNRLEPNVIYVKLFCWRKFI